MRNVIILNFINTIAINSQQKRISFFRLLYLFLIWQLREYDEPRWYPCFSMPVWIQSIMRMDSIHGKAMTVYKQCPFIPFTELLYIYWSHIFFDRAWLDQMAHLKREFSFGWCKPIILLIYSISVPNRNSSSDGLWTIDLHLNSES